MLYKPVQISSLPEVISDEASKPLWKVREEQEAAELLVQDSEEVTYLCITYVGVPSDSGSPSAPTEPSSSDDLVQQLPMRARCTVPMGRTPIRY